MGTPSLIYKKIIGDYQLTSENLPALSERWKSEANQMHNLLKQLEAGQELSYEDRNFLLTAKHGREPLPIDRLEYHFNH